MRWWMSFVQKRKRLWKQETIVVAEVNLVPLAQLTLPLRFSTVDILSTGNILVGDVIAFKSIWGRLCGRCLWLGILSRPISVVKWRRAVLMKCWKHDDEVNAAVPKCSKTIRPIEFKDFNFTYQSEKRDAFIKEINLTLNKGETLGVVGKTGSGRRHVMMAINFRTEEQLLINEPLIDYDPQMVAGHFTQEHTLFSRTIRENMLFGRRCNRWRNHRAHWRWRHLMGMWKRMPQQLDRWSEKGYRLVDKNLTSIVARAFLRNRDVWF